MIQKIICAIKGHNILTHQGSRRIVAVNLDNHKADTTWVCDGYFGKCYRCNELIIQRWPS